MHLNGSKYIPKYSCPILAPHSNLHPYLDSTISDWTKITKIMVLTVLDQFAIIGAQIGPDLKDEQFLGHCNSGKET